MSETALGVLADASLRAALVASLVAAALAALRVRAGATRHAAWTMVLVAMLLMPALSRLVPAVGVPVPPAARDIVAAAAVATPVTPVPRAERAPGPPASALVAPPRREGSSSGELARPYGRVGSFAGAKLLRRKLVGPVASSPDEWSWAATALAVYVGGMVPMLLRLVLGLWGSRRLARGARPIDRSTRRRVGALPVRVRESDRIAVPVTVGLFRSTVLLPPGWERWPDPKLCAVLAHEHAHVARRDPLVAGLASLNRCLFWFHPLAWWLQRTLALTAEQACDEAALRTAGAPQAYIDVLRSMAVAVRARGGRYLWEGVGMHGKPVADSANRAHPTARAPARRVTVLQGCPGRVLRPDPDVMSGAPVFAGTRVPLQALLDYLEAGQALAEFLEDFPTVSREQAIAALEQAKDALLTRA